MRELDLMRSLPKAKRNFDSRERARTPEVVEIARRYDEDYFDGSRDTGFGGYYYDGRWIPVARDIIDYFGLRSGNRVLDVGCAKGFLVKDLMQVGPDIEAFGLDISRYAVKACEPECGGRLLVGSCDALPFPDDSFDAVIAKDVIHNLDLDGCIRAVREVERLAPGRGFIQVDSYRTPEERDTFLRWVLTARTHCDPSGWRMLFEDAGYTGAYYWTIIE